MSWKTILPRRAAQAVIGILGLALVLVLTAGGLWGWISTESGKRMLADILARQASQPGFAVAIGALEGEVPFRMRLRDVTVTDHKGRWLIARTTQVSLDPHALLEGRLEIGEVAVSRLEITRPPLPEPETASPPVASQTPKAGAGKSGHGFAMAVRRLSIDELALGADLLGGEGALLHAEGTAEIGDRGSAQIVDLRFGQRDGLPGVGHLHVSYTPDTDRLEVDLAGSEPEGGVVARALGLPGLPALAFNAIGVAPLADWRGRITLAADGRGVLDIETTVRRTHGGYLIALTGGARTGGLLPASWSDITGPAPSIALSLLADDEGGLSLRPGSRVSLAAGTIAAEGALNPDTHHLSLRARTEPTPETLGALVLLPKDSRWKQASLEAGIEIGPGSPGPAFDLKADVDYLTGSDPMITRLAGPHLQGTARGVALRSGEIRLDAIAVTLAAGKLAGSGRLFPAERRLAVNGRLAADHLNRLLGAFGLPLNGVADLDLRLEGGSNGGRLDVSGTTANFSLADERIDPSLGALTNASLKIGGSIVVDAEGGLHAKGWSLEGARLGASGEAELIRGALFASGTITVPRLADTGIPGLSGGATLDVRATGPLATLEARTKLTLTDLGFGGQRLGRSELEVTGSDLPARPQVGFKLRALTGAPGVEALAAAGSVTLSGDGKRLSLSNLTLSQGANKAGGSVLATFEDAALTGLSGHLDGQVPALETLSPLLGTPLRGRGRFELELGRVNGRLLARASVDAAQVRAGGSAEAPDVAVAELELKGNASAAGFADFAAGRVSGSLSLAAKRIKAGDLTLASLGAGLDGSSDQAALQVTAPGFELAGSLGLGSGALKLELTRLTSQLGGVAVALGQPATIDLAPGRLSVAGLRLSGADFRLDADGRLGPDGLKGRVELERVPLELFHLLDATVPGGGRVDGEISLSGSANEPKADLALRFADAGRAEADAAGFSVGGFDGKITGRWQGGKLSLEGRAATSHGGADLRFSGETPLSLRLRPLGLYAPPTGKLSGTVTGSVDLAALNDILATSGDRVTGRMAVDVTVSGSPAAPDLGGKVTIDGAHYENLALGTVIDHIAARLTGNGRAFVVESFSGTAANGGIITVTGTVRPAADQTFDLHIKADNARLVQIDGATVDADADLAFTGGIREGRLAGSLELRRADIRLPDQLPAEIVDLQVEERVKSKSSSQKAKPDDKPAPAPLGKVPNLGPPVRLNLALAVNARNQVMVHGRGLETEFGCELTLGGTALAPEPKGSMTMQHGKLEVLGKEFQFKRGLIVFPGGKNLNPELDMLAEAKASSITAQAALTGTVKAPRLVLTSTPPVPQDEVLSRLLFDKSVSQLGALEAVQLADSATQLMGIGGSSGLVDRLRRSLGVDRLGVTSTGTANPLNPASGAQQPAGTGTTTGTSSGLGSALEAGRYVSRDVYLGVQQGLTADSSRAKVEVGITDNIQAEVGVGVRADPQVGVKLQWDY